MTVKEYSAVRWAEKLRGRMGLHHRHLAGTRDLVLLDGWSHPVHHYYEVSLEVTIRRETCKG